MLYISYIYKIENKTEVKLIFKKLPLFLKQTWKKIIFWNIHVTLNISYICKSEYREEEKTVSKT